MADLINNPSNVNANYNFEDIAAGFGEITYYLFSWDDDGTIKYGLTKDIIDSADPAEKRSSAGDLDFDSPTFRLPKILQGTATFTFMGANQDQGGGGNPFKPIIKVMHWDGTTETQIGSDINGGGLGASGTAVKKWTLRANLPRTKFRKGDLLRINVSWVTVTPDEAELGFSPTDQDGDFLTPSSNADHTTIFKAIIPFNIDI